MSMWQGGQRSARRGEAVVVVSGKPWHPMLLSLTGYLPLPTRCRRCHMAKLSPLSLRPGVHSITLFVWRAPPRDMLVRVVLAGVESMKGRGGLGQIQ